MAIITKNVKYIAALAPSRQFAVPFEDWLIPFNESIAFAILLDGTVFGVGIDGSRYITKRVEAGFAILEILNLNGDTIELRIELRNPIQATPQEILSIQNPCACNAGSADANCVDEFETGPSSIFTNLGPFAANIQLDWTGGGFLPVKAESGYWEIRNTIPLAGTADAMLPTWQYLYQATATGSISGGSQLSIQEEGLDSAGGAVFNYTRTQVFRIPVLAGETVDDISIQMAAEIGTPNGSISSGTTIACFKPTTSFIISNL